ncbi:glycosyltransferase family 2 protein [Helicobacter sp. MIT 14-3879]|uniref:glycosyltransferase family 2 protein n=1 Tax=Helicobacter sp. MIT 14-3879 TaxID=2040649 RepID=UPI000E1EBD37|nr:glycosyltransferase family 2 protein [Helicobacter sp. MIT 14-3879]RDU63194.1 glycosyltransferase family 2 protein [Helicobacter sp. MIT 14-3879]
MLIKNNSKAIYGFNKNPFFSIIIPTYNVEKYIARAIESCINQNFKNIEILIIDDCGSDNSINIARDYAKKDLRIRIIHNKKNLGTFQTRLEGIKKIKGEYVLFLDADDYLDFKACEKIYCKIHNKEESNNKADIIHFKAHYLGNKNSTKLENIKHKIRYILPTCFSKKPLKDNKIVYNFFLRSNHFPKFTLWDKCYKRNILIKVNKILEPITANITMAEDMLKFFVIASISKSYLSINEKLYFYCLNNNSSTQNINNINKRIFDINYIINILPIVQKKLLNYKYTKEVTQKMSKNLKSLIILEQRFYDLDNMGGVDIVFTNSLDYLKNYSYLGACIASLKYWNRSLTYIRIIVYILSFGKIKL